MDIPCPTEKSHRTCSIFAKSDVVIPWLLT